MSSALRGVLDVGVVENHERCSENESMSESGGGWVYGRCGNRIPP